MSDRRDRLYAEPQSDVEAFVFDGRVAAVFPDMIRRSVPGYGTVIAMTGVIAARYHQPGTAIYDLGCSQGASTLSMARQLEVPADTVARAAAEFDGFCWVNLAPAKQVDVTVLQRADLLIVNELEAAWYGDTLNACSGMIVTTVGAAGATISQGGDDIAVARPPRIEAVDTTAAGDTFTAALTVAIVEGQSPQQALEFACAAGAAACTRLGAQPSLPTRDEVLSLGA